MPWTSFTSLGSWFQMAERYLPFVAVVLSLAILFGCAIASWLVPSEDTDQLFHREVI